MADRTVRVTLSAQVQGYIAGMKEAAQATRDTGSEAEKLALQSQAFEQMGRAAMVAGGAVVAGMTLATKAAIDWDSAWAGVTKTVDGSPEQLAAVEAGLRGLTAVLPASHTEIAAVAEAAGQLGIETPNVVAFTKTMIDLGETTNLSSDQAATSLARFMTVMGTSQSDVAALGSALVELGNNYATTESEILEMSMRLAGAGAQIGMTEGQVLGLSTALSSVGIEAEAGGSAMSKVMIDIASSVDKGGARLEQFASVAGVSASSFAEKWKKDPGDALALFVQGLANAEAQGKSTFGILEELGITEVRMRDALLRSSSAADQFSEAMSTGNAAMEENVALTEEAEKRYETTAAQLSMMKNRVVDAAISIGEQLLPAVEYVAEGVGDFAEGLAGLDGPMAAVVAWGGLIAGGIVLAGGAALAAVPKIAAYRVALDTLGYSGSSLQGKVRGIGAFLGGPWGLALAGAATATHLFNEAMESTQVTAGDMLNVIKQDKSALDEMMQAATGGNAFSDFWLNNTENIKNFGDVLNNVKENGNNWWADMFTRTVGENNAIADLENLGTALQQVAVTDMPKAQAAFKQFYDEAGLNGTQALTALNDIMPGFKSSLIDAADTAGLATDDATLLKLALGEVGPAADDATRGAEDNADALSELEAAAAETQAAVSELADEIRNFGDTTFDMRDANRQLEQSYQDLAAALAESGGSFDITTDAGRAAEAALDDVAQATNNAAAGILAATNDQDAMNAKLAEGREALINIMTPYFGTRDAAAAYVDQLNLISPQKVTEIIAETESASARINTFMSEYDGRRITIHVDAETGASTRAMLNNANGGIYAYADGGIESYANGGIPTGIYSGGTPLYKFAEPETGWEAFISGKPSERDRNRQIWVDAGERLGMGVGGSSKPPVVYVQNPFTGEYLLGKVDQRANRAIDTSLEQQARELRKAGQ